MDDDELPAEDVAARLAAAIGKVSRRIRPTVGELSMGHFSTLATIDRLGATRPGSLARIERVSAPTMTRIVARLEERGMVARQQDAEDARAVTIAVTAKGRRVMAATRAERTATVGTLLTVLNADQLATIRASLDALEAVAVAAAEPEFAPR